MAVKPENRFWIGIYGFTGFIMLVAMGVFGWLAWTSRQEPGIGRVAGAPKQAVSASIPEERYELLAAFRAPQYSVDPAAPATFKDGMKHYTNQDFAGAIPALRMLPDFPAARFYLGICLLLTGDRISGIQELRAISDAGSGPYLERSRFYLAKGLIAEHDIAHAQKQLESVIAQHGDLESQAAALLAQITPSSLPDSLRFLGRRSTEQRDDRLIERRNVVGLAAGNQPVILNHRLIRPLGPGVP
jgi:predicted negative regulator of RcsB-dependent stress response